MIDKGLIEEARWTEHRDNWYTKPDRWSLLVSRLLSYISDLEIKLEFAYKINKYSWFPHESRVLILGNGVSRIQHQDFIDAWDGELWVCNWAYRDFPKAHKLVGHKEVMLEAFKEDFLGQVWSNRDAWGPRGAMPEWISDLTDETGFPKKWQRDAGTTFVAFALYLKYRKIYVCGFDMGGPDVYWPEHKGANWIYRWKEIAEEFGLDQIQFVGEDLKERILTA